MKHLKALFSCCLPLIAVLLIAMAAKQPACIEPRMFLCRHTYALCTSARCVPAPDSPTNSICYCDVEEGFSMSTVPCCQLGPSIGLCGPALVYSTFSMKQLMEGRKVMKCPGSAPWSWCLNKPCTIDPCDRTKALCMCDVIRTKGDWVTFGGCCDNATCNNSYWSGAAINDFDAGIMFMMNEMNLKESPVKWCPL